ncbi:hypothetical protein Cni_G11552 [Canna indica]|uniref:Cotton fiber protein n=1 Tax=Canna indica TaxID=4628 RepID=A0AAQ3QBC1_9LILI|nr:hypothetical protein Cni_G11552 [Canna indica]
MARKRNRIVGKALRFLAKAKKPIARNLKSFHLLGHYNYDFIAECEFSPPSSPPFRYPRARATARKQRSRFLALLCGGAGDELRRVFRDELEIMSPAGGGIERSEPPAEYEGEEEATVDQRAERFIAKFYEEMRIQRQILDAAPMHAMHQL